MAFPAKKFVQKRQRGAHFFPKKLLWRHRGQFCDVPQSLQTLRRSYNVQNGLHLLQSVTKTAMMRWRAKWCRWMPGPWAETTSKVTKGIIHHSGSAISSTRAATGSSPWNSTIRKTTTENSPQSAWMTASGGESAYGSVERANVGDLGKL